MIAQLGVFAQQLKKNPILPWAVAFILLNVIVSQDGEGNAASRFATLQAMAEHHTFQIDPYKSWTGDWSLSPNGHYYSNKAPGPMLVAFPLAWLLSALTHYVPFDMGLKSIICLVYQVIPFAVIVLLLSNALADLGVSVAGRTLAAIAMLFGNTADLFMNCFFGHGMAAMFLLGLVLAVYKRRYAWAGFCFGFAILCDYGAGFVGVPFFLALAWTNRGNLKGLFQNIVLGGLIPGVLWVWYHWTCFGSPFALSVKYINPDFLDPGPLFSALPPKHVLYELLSGPHRGILVTQPWFYVVLGALFVIGRKELRSISFIAVVGFLGLLWMNAGFSGWHGGAIAGPRYLCSILPVFGFLAGSIYDRLGKIGKSLLWVTVGVSLIYRQLVYCDILYMMPTQELWPYYVGSMVAHFFSKYAVSFVLFWTVIGGAAFWQLRSLRFSNVLRTGIPSREGA